MATHNEWTEMRIEFIVKDLTLNTCLSSHDAVPAVGIRLLDFPSVLVYLPQNQHQNSTGATFRFNRGKSCLLQANPERLAARLEASLRPIQISVLDMSASTSPSLVGTGKLLCDSQLLDSLRQSSDKCLFEGKYLISLFDRTEKNIAVVTLKLRITYSTISRATGDSTPDKQPCSPRTATAVTVCSSETDRKDSEQCDNAEETMAVSSCEPHNKEEYLPNSWLPSPLVYKGTKMSCFIQSDCKEISRTCKMPDQPTSWVETQTHWTTLVKADLNNQPLQTPPLKTEQPTAPTVQANSVLTQLPVLSAMLSELSLLKTIDRGPQSVQPIMATTGVQTDYHQSTIPPTLPCRQEEPRTPCKNEKKASRQFMRECCDASYLTSTSPNSSVRSYKNRARQQQPGRRANKHKSKPPIADANTSHTHSLAAKPGHPPHSVEQQLNDSSTTRSSQVMPCSPQQDHQEQELSLPADEQASVTYSDSLEVTPVAPQEVDLNIPHIASQESSSSRHLQHQPLSPPTTSSSSSSVKPTVPMSLSRADSLDSTAAVLPQISQKLYLASSQSIDMAGLSGPVDSSYSISFSLTSSGSLKNKQTAVLHTGSSTTAGSDGEGYSDSFESDIDSNSSNTHYTSCHS